MPRRDVAKRRHRKVPVGDLRDKIVISERVEIPTGNRPTIEYDAIGNPWSKLETLDPGSSQFNGIDIQERPTHAFTVRDQLRFDVESGQVIDFKDYRYRIFTHQKIDGRDEYIKIFAKILGKQELGAARS